MRLLSLLTAILLGVLGGCEPSYLVHDSDIRAANAGRPTVPAELLDDDDASKRTPVRLKGEALDSAVVVATSSNGVTRVTPHNPGIHASWWLAGIGAALTAGAVTALAMLDQPGCSAHGDEGCWLAQGTAGLTLGSVGAVFLNSSIIVALKGLRAAEAR